jgi:hypothetical protein
MSEAKVCSSCGIWVVIWGYHGGEIRCDGVECNPSTEEVIYELTNYQWIPVSYQCITCLNYCADSYQSVCENCYMESDF